MSGSDRPTTNEVKSRATESPRRGMLGWVVRHPKLTGLGVLLLLLLGTCELFDMRAEQAFQHELDAIRASGAPLTLDDLNAVKCDVPDEENAAILIEAPTKKIVARKSSKEELEHLPFLGMPSVPPCGERLKPEEHEAAEAYLAAIEQPLAEVHEALKHERGCRNVQWTSPAVDGLVTADYSGIRTTSQALRITARMSAEADDRDDAYLAVCDLMAMDRSLHGDSAWLRMLVRLTVRGIAMESAADVVNLGELNDSQLAGLQTMLQSPDWIQAGRRAMEVERVLILDTVQWLFTAQAPAGNMPAPSPFLRFIPIIRPAGNAKALQVWQEYIDAFDQPEAMILPHFQLIGKGMRDLPDYCLLWKNSGSAYSGAASLVLRTTASQRAMIAALACERYRLGNGDWPESLDALVPEHLDAVPIDPFDAKPVRYVQFEHGIIVYSVGEDQRDGGGDVTHRDINKPKEKPTDEGYVLLNPELRNREPAAGDDAKDESADEES